MFLDLCHGVPGAQLSQFGLSLLIFPARIFCGRSRRWCSRINVNDKENVARLDALDKRIAKCEKRQPDASPFLRRTEAIRLLKTRSLLERCERAGWIKATTRQARLVLYLRVEVMAAIYRISQGEYP
jgi:hypothetical protein